MKFFLTIYLCSVITQDCVIPQNDNFKNFIYFNDHYECVQKGLGESYELLFSGEFFTKEDVLKYELYPKFSCEKVEVKTPKPKPKNKDI